MKSLGKAYLSFEELQTSLCDVEAVINSRPLVYISEDDLNETLTPSHLMYGRDVMKSRRHQQLLDNLSVTDYSKRYKYLNSLLDQCWRRFASSYLNELRQHNIYRKQRSNSGISVTVNDVVLIKEEKPTPRSRWRCGRIVEVINGRDGYPRGVKLLV